MYESDVLRSAISAAEGLSIAAAERARPHAAAPRPHTGPGYLRAAVARRSGVGSMVTGLRRRGPRTPPGRNEGAESPATAQVSPAPEPLPLQQQQQRRRRGGRHAGDTAPNKGKKHDTGIRQQVWDAWQRCVGRDKQMRGKRGLASAGGTKQLKAICAMLGPPRP
jgi:hypothetical protein